MANLDRFWTSLGPNFKIIVTKSYDRPPSAWVSFFNTLQFHFHPDFRAHTHGSAPRSQRARYLSPSTRLAAG